MVLDRCGHKASTLPAQGSNQVWAYDFVYDACANGQQLKCLTVIDEYTREALAIDVAGGIRSGRVIEFLSRLNSLHDAPRYLRSYNGAEFVSKALLNWLLAANIDKALSDPGKPWQNGSDESFNGKFRDVCLSLDWFRNRTEAMIMIENWRRHYNAVRPHSSLGYLTPDELEAIEFKTKKATTKPDGLISCNLWTEKTRQVTTITKDRIWPWVESHPGRSWRWPRDRFPLLILVTTEGITKEQVICFIFFYSM